MIRTSDIFAREARRQRVTGLALLLSAAVLAALSAASGLFRSLVSVLLVSAVAGFGAAELHTASRNSVEAAAHRSREDEDAVREVLRS